MSVMEAFAVGGAWMYVVALLALVGLPLDLLALLLAVGARFAGGITLTLARLTSLGVLLFSGVPLLAGAVGWWIATGRVEAAVELAAPEFRDELLAVGHAEARVPLIFGGGVSAALVALAVVACVVAWLPRRPTEPDEG